jgi:hypothetical protein
MSRPFLIASALSVLAACGPASEAMPAKPPKPEATAGTDLLVTPTALGPVTRATPFDRHAIQRLFRQSDVSLEFAADRPRIVVYGPGDLHLVFRGRIGGVVLGGTARGGAVRGPNGETVGDRLSGLGLTKAACAPRDDDLVCTRPGVEGVRFILSPRQSRDPVVQAIEWTPGAP